MFVCVVGKENCIPASYCLSLILMDIARLVQMSSCRALPPHKSNFSIHRRVYGERLFQARGE